MLEQRHIEIHQEPKATTGQLQIGQKLRLVDGLQRFHGLDLNDDRALDKDVDAIPGIDPRITVGDRQNDLALQGNAPTLKLVGQTVFVGGFEQARAEGPVRFQPAIDDDSRQAFDMRRQGLAVFVVQRA